MRKIESPLDTAWNLSTLKTSGAELPSISGRWVDKPYEFRREIVLIRGKMIERERKLNHCASCRSLLCSLITKISKANKFSFSRIIIIILIMMSFIVFEFLKAVRLAWYCTQKEIIVRKFVHFTIWIIAFCFQFNFSCFFALEEAKKLLKNNDKTFFALDGSW